MYMFHKCIAVCPCFTPSILQSDVPDSQWVYCSMSVFHKCIAVRVSYIFTRVSQSALVSHRVYCRPRFTLGVPQAVRISHSVYCCLPICYTERTAVLPSVLNGIKRTAVLPSVLNGIKRTAVSTCFTPVALHCLRVSNGVVGQSARV